MASLASTLLHSSSSRSSSAARRSQYLRSVRTASALRSQIGDRRQRALRHRVHHARLGQHVNHLPARGPRGAVELRRVGIDQPRVAHPRHDGPLDDAVGQQLADHAADLLVVKVALNQIPLSGRHAQPIGDPQIGRRRGHGRARPIGLARGRIDVNFPQHRECVWPRPRVVPAVGRRPLRGPRATAPGSVRIARATRAGGAVGQHDLPPQNRVAGRDTRRIVPSTGSKRNVTLGGRTGNGRRHQVGQVAGGRQGPIVFIGRHFQRLRAQALPEIGHPPAIFVAG